MSSFRNVSKMFSICRGFVDNASCNRAVPPMNMMMQRIFTRHANSFREPYTQQPTETPKSNETGNRFMTLKKESPLEIIHEDENIIALNKPQYLSVYGGTSVVEEGKDTIRNGSCHTFPKSVAQMLPALATKLGHPDLQIGLSLKSFYSGIVLLCRSDKSLMSLEKLLSRAAAQKIPFVSYLAITVGVPQCSYRTPIHSYVAQEFLHGQSMSVIYEKDSHSARKDGKMMLFSHTVEPLAVSSESGAALFRITVNKDKWGAVEATLSHYLSPVLGDTVYSARTHTVMGAPFAASPHSAPPGPQRLPPKLAECLHGDPDILPEGRSRLFVHRHEINLSRFPHEAAPPLTITATPPPHFMAALKCLGLLNENVLPRS